jgi:hypothetical protein
MFSFVLNGHDTCHTLEGKRIRRVLEIEVMKEDT